MKKTIQKENNTKTVKKETIHRQWKRKQNTKRIETKTVKKENNTKGKEI